VAKNKFRVVNKNLSVALPHVCEYANYLLLAN